MMLGAFFSTVQKWLVLLYTQPPARVESPLRQKIANVQAGRGIAALLVVLFHCASYYFSSQKYWSDAAWGGVFRFGRAGVEFFFVLSGYIILSVHYQDIGKAAKVIPFLKKRFLRIYPLFWLVLFISVVAVKFLPQADGIEYSDLPTVFQSFLLAGKNPHHTVVLVSWSLWHEVLFYAIFATTIGYPRVGVPLMVIWASVCLLDLTPEDSSALPPYTIDVINVLFVFGMFAALLLRRASVPAPRLVLFAGLVVFLGTGLYENRNPNVDLSNLRLFYGFGSALALLGAVEIERLQGVRAPSWLVLMGNASYSIYLTHILWLKVLAKLAASANLPKIVPTWIAFPCLALAAVLGGVLVHFLIEVPLIRSVWLFERKGRLRRPETQN